MGSIRFHAVASVALFALVACGGPGAEEAQAVQASGVRVVLDTTAPFAQATDFQARLDDTLDVALAYWGGTRSDIDGKTITFVDSLVSCRGQDALGCYDGNISVTTRDPGLGTFACVEETVLVHEIGHAVLGDGNHEDPRWMQMDEIASALSGRVGYASGGETDCTMYVSVWRHPLGTP
jgi:hypothetical protein